MAHDYRRLRAAQLLLDQARAELAGSREPEAPRFSLTRAISQMIDGGLRDGFEREVCADAAASLKLAFEPNRITIPWRHFATRDLTVDNTGGYLIATDTGRAVDALRPWSVSLRAGLTVLDNLRGSLVVPRTAGDIAGGWLAVDGVSAATPADPTLGQAALTVKSYAAVVNLSHLFMKQSAQAEGYIRQHLARVAGRALDAAILGGSGALGEPQGINITPGIGLISGASLDWSDVLEMRETVTTAGADDTRLSWIAAPTVRQVLAARERVSTSGRMLWDDNEIDGRAAYATPDAPAATLFLADFSQVALGLWGPGLRIDVNPYQDFRAGVVALRVVLDCDVAVLQPSAVCVATSVS